MTGLYAEWSARAPIPTGNDPEVLQDLKGRPFIPTEVDIRGGGWPHVSLIVSGPGIRKDGSVGLQTRYVWYRIGPDPRGALADTPHIDTAPDAIRTAVAELLVHARTVINESLGVDRQ